MLQIIKHIKSKIIKSEFTSLSTGAHKQRFFSCRRRIRTADLMIPLRLLSPFHFALPPELYGIYILMISPIECGSPIRSRSFQMVRYSCSQVQSSLISSIHADRRLAPLLVFRASSPIHITTLTSFGSGHRLLVSQFLSRHGVGNFLCTSKSKNNSSFFIVRKVRDSNSRSVFPLASLAVRCFRPLSQPSNSEILKFLILKTSGPHGWLVKRYETLN